MTDAIKPPLPVGLLTDGEASIIRAWAEALADAAVAQERREIDRLREALQLIAAPMRPDGTYNRDRRACELLARAALGEP